MAGSQDYDKKIQEEIKNLSGETQKYWKQIYEDIKKSTSGDAAKKLEELFKALTNYTKEINNELSYTISSFNNLIGRLNESNAKLQFQETILSRANKLLRDTLEIRKGDAYADASKIKSLQKEAELEINNLRLLQQSYNINSNEYKEIQKQIDGLKTTEIQLNNILNVDKELNKQLGIGRQTLSQLDSVVTRLGLPNLGLNQAYQNTMMMGQAAKAAGLPFDAIKTYSSQLSLNISKAFSFTLLLAGAIKLIIETFTSVDKSTGDLAKNFDKSYAGASKMRNELTGIANKSMDVAVTTKGLQESMVAIGSALGVNAQLNEKDLVTFTKLREQAGFTNQELVGMQRATLAQGGTLEDNAKKFLGTVEKMNAQNKLSINAKQLLKEVANVSDAIRLSVGGTVEKLAEAAFKAKQFGINLQQADQIASQLLNFEQSLSNELSAELITGKNLNFERARLLAINGDIAGASAEILKQVGGTAEFTKMNRIQQEAIAKAVGMTRDDLAKSLTDREAAQKLGAKEGQSAQDAYNAAVKKYGVEKANKMLGDEALARQYQQQSVQERFANAVEKLKEVFVSLVTPLLPVLDIFAQIFKIVGPIAGVIGEIVRFVVDWGKYLLIPYGILKGMQLVTKGMTALNTILIQQNTTKIAQNQAQVVSEGTKLGLGQRILAILGLQTAQGFYQEAIADGLGKKAALRMAMEETILGRLVLQGLNLGKNLIKYIGLTLQAGYRAIFENTIVGAILSQGAGLLKAVAVGAIRLVQSMATAAAELMGVSALTLGIGTAVAVAAAVAGYAVLKSMKGDDVMSESGYGNRTLLTPKGSIALNNEDTVIAGTNLFPSKKGDDVVSSPKGSISMPPSQPQVINNNTVLEFEGRALQTVANRQHRISNKP